MSVAPAQLHPGAVVHVWDHYVITLRDSLGAREGDGTGDVLDRHLSLYSISYSPELGSGHVCILDTGDEPVRLLADRPEAGRRMARRLRDMGSVLVDLPDEPMPARFLFHPLEASEGFRWSITSDAAMVEAEWSGTTPGMWAQGQAPAFRADEDIWACFVAADHATITLDGRTLGGAPFEQADWVTRLGRPLSSAHVALAEVRVTPEEGST